MFRNFLKFRPGLVGGHCIGVDPYYLTYQAEKFGHHAEVILSGRRINDSMGKYVAENTVKTMIRAGGKLQGGTVNILGLTFKENCPDVRNTKVVDIVKELKEYGLTVRVHDPYASPEEALHEYGIALTAWDRMPAAYAVVLAVSHREYLDKPLAALLEKVKLQGAVIDVKSVLDADAVRASSRQLWRL